MTKPLAIFDIDGTIFRSSLAVELIRQLVADGVFQPQILNDIETEYLAWLNREGSYEDFINKIIVVYGDYLKGTKETQMKKTCTHMIKTHKKRVYRYTRLLIRRLRKKGYLLLALSGSPISAVRAFQEAWKFNYALGTTFEILKGMYTGQVLGEPQKNKKKFLFSFIKEHGLSLKDSVGVGDTESDIAFLEEVEKPIAFNPNAKLKQEADKRGWKIVVERKDVIWEVGT